MKKKFICPRCETELVFGKKRSPNYTCHHCKQQMFITSERLADPALLRRSVEMFRDNSSNYKVIINNRQYDNSKRRPNNFISK